MQVNLIGCIFVLESEKNDNIRKNEIKKLKLLVDTNNLVPSFSFNNGDIKNTIKDNVYKILGTKVFHLEQVYSYSNDNIVNIVYLIATNIDNITKLDSNYKLIDFNIIDNNTIIYGDNKYKYKTKEIEENNNIEYIHDIDVKDKVLNDNLVYILSSYKRIRANIDNTDIIFKFMSKSFTLEDVRILYELIKDTSVDKSNFRKRIIKYCEKVDSNEQVKIGYRPSQRYRFKPLKGDIWL